MYEIRSRDLDGKVVGQSENLQTVKEHADNLRQKLNQHFDIYEVKQVWTTQTLDEVIKNTS